MKGDVSSLMKIAKKVVEKSTYRKLSEMPKNAELETTLKHAVVSALENKAYLLEKKISYLKNYGKDVFFAENKFIQLSGKIKHFKASFSEEDYNKTEIVLKEVVREIENV